MGPLIPMAPQNMDFLWEVVVSQTSPSSFFNPLLRLGHPIQTQHSSAKTTFSKDIFLWFKAHFTLSPLSLELNKGFFRDSYRYSLEFLCKRRDYSHRHLAQVPVEFALCYRKDWHLNDWWLAFYSFLTEFGRFRFWKLPSVPNTLITLKTAPLMYALLMTIWSISLWLRKILTINSLTWDSSKTYFRVNFISVSFHPLLYANPNPMKLILN